MESAKITLVGAGGMSFGPTMVNDIVHTKRLKGSRLMLHDVNEQRLERAYQFASKINAASGAPMILDRSTDPGAALDGTNFVLSSSEFRRFERWREDFEIPNKYGARQITGENGGPGAVFHSLRSIHNTLGICESIERYSPEAFLINLTNPLSRVTLAINRSTKVKNVGMCHEMPMGINRLARRIGKKGKDIHAKACGINHFTFFTEFSDKNTGEDLLPKLKAYFKRPIFDFKPRTISVAKWLDRSFFGSGILESNYSPIVVRMVREFDMVPCSVDSHIGEYLPFALESAPWHPVPLDFHEPVMKKAERMTSWVAKTATPLPLKAWAHSPEEVIPIIAAMWTGDSTPLKAVNVPNKGYISDVPDGAIVEVGATVDADGIHPESMGPVGEPLSGWIGTQVHLQDLIVDAAIKKDPDLAFQAVCEDPSSPADKEDCQKLFDELLTLQREDLPF